jgi:hypothetical protein
LQVLLTMKQTEGRICCSSRRYGICGKASRRNILIGGNPRRRSAMSKITRREHAPTEIARGYRIYSLGRMGWLPRVWKPLQDPKRYLASGVISAEAAWIVQSNSASKCMQSTDTMAVPIADSLAISGFSRKQRLGIARAIRVEGSSCPSPRSCRNRNRREPQPVGEFRRAWSGNELPRGRR